MTMGVGAHHSPAPVPRTWHGRSARSLACNTVVLAANEVSGGDDDGGGCSPFPSARATSVAWALHVFVILWFLVGVRLG